MRVLVVEDERRLAENIAASFTELAKYAVDVACDGEEGLYLARENDYDLIVLDLMLPKIPGEKVLQDLRAAQRRAPVLILTARDEKALIVRLLNSGADDYVVKPFDLGELLARAKALIRRGKGVDNPVISIAELQINSNERRVTRGGRELRLTPMEYRVLEYLAHRRRAVVSKTELLEHLYDFNWESFSNVIEVYISALRRKVDGGFEKKLIHTLRGHGYALRDEDGGESPVGRRP
jgi:DNA-binding response OmpR family regulator